MPFRRIFVLSCILATSLTVFSGCSSQEPITTYTAPKEIVPDDARAPEPKPARMLATLLPIDRIAWSFKLQGSPDEMTQLAESYRTFLDSVRFEASGVPAWKLPEGWTQKAGGQFRFATLVIPTDDSSLELSVSQVTNNSDDLTDYLLQNMNRWRGQLQLAPIETDQLDAETERITVGGETAYLLDISGMHVDDGGPMARMSNAPFMN